MLLRKLIRALLIFSFIYGNHLYATLDLELRGQRVRLSAADEQTSHGHHRSSTRDHHQFIITYTLISSDEVVVDDLEIGRGSRQHWDLLRPPIISDVIWPLSLARGFSSTAWTGSSATDGKRRTSHLAALIKRAHEVCRRLWSFDCFMVLFLGENSINVYVSFRVSATCRQCLKKRDFLRVSVGKTLGRFTNAIVHSGKKIGSRVSLTKDRLWARLPEIYLSQG